MLLLGFHTNALAVTAETPDNHTASQTITGAEPASLPQIGQVVNGFEALEIRDFPLMNAAVVRFMHQKTGAELYYFANDDTNRVFDLTFRTEAYDNTGVPHVFEHATTDGSEKYPSKQLFFNLEYQTYNTFMNAYTYNHHTTYPVASMSEAQLLKLADYYTDSCFHPMLMEDESIFRTEAWRYRLDDPDDPLTIEGTVYSEMLGKRSVERSAYLNAMRAMFPDTTAGNDSGGDPDYIPDLLITLETDSHSRGDLAKLIGRYLYDGTILVTSYQDSEDEFHPWLKLSWTTLDDDLDENYDLIRELLFETKVDDSDRILEQVQTLRAGFKYSFTDHIEEMMLDRAFARDSQRLRYNSYAHGFDFYDFLVRTQKQLQEDPGTVTAKLKDIQDALNNRTNAVVIFAGNESSIALNRTLSDEFLASLDAHEIERAEYALPLPEKDEALIIDSGVQYNAMTVSYSTMGRNEYEGWMTVAAHIVTDYYLTPILRDRYGVYDPYCGNYNTSDGGILIFSYQDPNIAETFDLIHYLPEMLSEEEIDQEIMDGYILSSYSYFATPKGVLSGAINAAEATLKGKPQDETLTWLRQLKQCTPEKLAEWAEMLKVLVEEGTVRTAGGAAAINAEADRYDKILDPFGTGDRK